MLLQTKLSCLTFLLVTTSIKALQEQLEQTIYVERECTIIEQCKLCDFLMMKQIKECQIEARTSITQCRHENEADATEFFFTYKYQPCRA